MPERPLLLRNGMVFDTALRTFQRADLACDPGGAIAAIAATLEPPPGAAVLDLDGAFILPGLIDCHVHIESSGAPGAMVNNRAEPLPMRAWRAAQHARATLEAGFTTVRDLGAGDQLNIHLQRAIDSGLLEGPHMLAAGLGVTMTGGHGHGFIAREADGPDEVRKAVREQLRAGATAIKLFASGGVMTPGVDPRAASLTEAELAAGVEEAHKAFRVVAAHAQATDGIKNAIRAGVDSIEHGVWLDEEAIGLMLERGTYLVPTLTAPYHIAHGGLEAGIAPHMVEKAHQVLQDHRESFRQAVKAGVNIAMGTDQGTPLSYPGENAQEIVRMVENGLSPAAGILAATAWAAALLRLDARRGMLREGFDADLVVLREDPLGDITALQRPQAFVAVLKAGAFARRDPAVPFPGGDM